MLEKEILATLYLSPLPEPLSNFFFSTYSDDDNAHKMIISKLVLIIFSQPLPPFKFFLCRLCIQQAITRILISTTTVPSETPINIKRPLDVFMKGLPVVSVCCVVRIDNDCCGATGIVKKFIISSKFSTFILFLFAAFKNSEKKSFFFAVEARVEFFSRKLNKIHVKKLCFWIIETVNNLNNFDILSFTLVRYAQSRGEKKIFKIRIFNEQTYLQSSSKLH